MNNQPLFTIATITYNSSQWVREAIESVLASIYTDFEYIISDDCSTDDTWKIIQEYKDPRIRAWQNEKNIGEYPNRQKVLEQARGKYILYIDGDDMLYKDSLQRYFWYLQDYPDVKAIWGVEYGRKEYFKFPQLLQSKTVLELTYLRDSLICFVGLAESLFEVNALKSIGGFDMRFAIGDTFIKKKFASYFDVLVVPLGMSYWRMHKTQASKLKTEGYAGFIQNYRIDQEILNSESFPLRNDHRELAMRKFKTRTVKLLVSKTILKAKIGDFFSLRSKLKIPFSYFKYLFK